MFAIVLLFPIIFSVPPPGIIQTWNNNWKKILFPVQSFTHPVSIIIIFYNLIDFIRKKKKKKNCGKIIEKQKKTVCFAVSCTFFLLLFLSTTNASSIFRIDFRKFAIHSIDVSRNISSQFFSSILINYLLLFSLFNFFFLIHFIRPLIFFENSIRCDLWRRKKKKKVKVQVKKGRYP